MDQHHSRERDSVGLVTTMSPHTYNPGHEIAGDYRIVELLGVGRTAEVYLADDLS